MRSLIAFATQWGSKYGGINSFNTDFLTAFGDTYHDEVQVICIVSSATVDEIAQAKENHVTLVQLPYKPDDKIFTGEQAEAAIVELKKQAIQLDPEHTIWLGHDRISGEAAIKAARLAGGRSALIHHMSYDAYEAFAEDSHSAYNKTQNQRTLFEQADLRLAVGSLLRDALMDLLGIPKEQIHMIIPGLADITPRPETPNTFTAFLSGRLGDDAAKIKQGYLGIAAFSQAIADAQKNKSPVKLVKSRPKLLLRGVDFESCQNYKDPEKALQQFAANFAEEQINLQTLPFTQNREQLYNDLKSASVALMPSWHEGFGLVAWEAIAAGVPLIVSIDSGVYQFLDDYFHGDPNSYVVPIKVGGSGGIHSFSKNDLANVAEAITYIAQDPVNAKKRAADLRAMLLKKYTWEACVTGAADYFDWQVKKNTAITDTPPNNALPSPLEMPRKYWQQGCGYSESRLLHADEALVPFDAARQPAIDQLNTWLDDDNFPVAIRLMTGAGGLGKTRLAIEICEQRLQRGWHCGFLSKENSAKDMTTAWQQLLAFKQPILLVMDYAETRQAVLLAFIKALLKTPNSQPVRLLLLARNGGEWWDNLPSKDADCEVLLSSYATSGAYALPELYLDTNSRHIAYTLALKAYANATGKTASHIQPDLSGEHFAKPLYLQMAALLALYGEHPATAEGLTNALLNHERRYWAKALADTPIYQPENYAQHLLALATLSGGFATPKQAKTFFGNGLTTSEFTALFNALVPLYPASRQGLQTVQPDLLGEALVAKALAETNGEELLNETLGNHADSVIQHHALTVIARLSDHRPLLETRLTEALTRHFCHCHKAIVEVAIETRSQLSTLAQTAFTNLPPAEKSQAAGLLTPLLQNESVELARLACAIDLFTMEKSKKKLAKKPKDTKLQAEHADSLYNLSISLDRLGDNKQAIRFAEKALIIYKCLAKDNPVRFESNYARSLNSYGNCLSNVGRDEEAIGYAKDALDIQQRLAAKKPDHFEQDYAMYLNNYAISLLDMGRDEEAIHYAKDALDIRERWAKYKPDQFESYHAKSLNTYASTLGNVGRDEEAVGYSKDALDIQQRLVEKNPDRFTPVCAITLNNYASKLSNVGKDEASIYYAEQALVIYQRLAQKIPAYYEVFYYDVCCNVLFISWLANKPSISPEKQDAITKLPSIMTVYQKARCLFRYHFVQACLAITATQQAEQFKQVLEHWQALSKADQHAMQDYFLSSCAWLHYHEPTALTDIDWLDNWQQFQQQRQNRLPQWMQTLAQRLNFHFPEPSTLVSTDVISNQAA